MNHDGFSSQMHRIYMLGLSIFLIRWSLVVDHLSFSTLLFLHTPFNSFYTPFNLNFMHPTFEFITPSPHNLLYVHVNKPPLYVRT